MSVEYIPKELPEEEHDVNEDRFVASAVKNRTEQLTAYKNIDLATIPLLP